MKTGLLVYVGVVVAVSVCSHSLGCGGDEFTGNPAAKGGSAGAAKGGAAGATGGTAGTAAGGTAGKGSGGTNSGGTAGTGAGAGTGGTAGSNTGGTAGTTTGGTAGSSGGTGGGGATGGTAGTAEGGTGGGASCTGCATDHWCVSGTCGCSKKWDCIANPSLNDCTTVCKNAGYCQAEARYHNAEKLCDSGTCYVCDSGAGYCGDNDQWQYMGHTQGEALTCGVQTEPSFKDSPACGCYLM